MAFHVNPKTGNPGRCSAIKGGCPFGGEQKHFKSKEEAHEAFEEFQRNLEAIVSKADHKPGKGAIAMAMYDPYDYKIESMSLWSDNPSYLDFIAESTAATEGSSIVLTNGYVLTKDEAIDSNYWRVEYTDRDALTSIESGTVAPLEHYDQLIKAYGGWLESGGKAPESQIPYRMPDGGELAYASGELASRFNSELGAPELESLDEALSDYVVERWHGLTPSKWGRIEEKLKQELGEPRNYGSDDEPAWGWSR